MSMPIFDPSSGLKPLIGQLVIYVQPSLGNSQWNRKFDISVIPWSGNHSGREPISSATAQAKLEEDLQHSRGLANAYEKGGASGDGWAISWAVIKSTLTNLRALPGIIEQEPNDLKNGSGIFGGALPTWMVEDGVQKYLTDAPTASSQFFTPEYVTSFTQKHGHPPFASDELDKWLSEMQSRGFDIEAKTYKVSEDLIPIARGSMSRRGVLAIQTRLCIKSQSFTSTRIHPNHLTH